MNSDHISVITAMPGDEIAVLWSNQETERFGFRVHADGADPATWSADEVPASGSALNVGAGMADDHLNVAVASDGTMYAAVKTSYDTSGYPKMAMLLRTRAAAGTRCTGSTRPARDRSFSWTRVTPNCCSCTCPPKVPVTSSTGTSSTSSVSFSAKSTMISGGLAEPTSTKQTYTDDLVVLATSGSNVVGRHCAAAAPVNHAPVANDNGYSTPQDTPKIVAAPGVLGNDTDTDGDDLTAVKLTDPTHEPSRSTRTAGSPTRRTRATPAPTPSPSRPTTATSSRTRRRYITVTRRDRSGLVGHWTMDGDLTDASSAAHPTTGVGSPTFDTGRIGQALVLNGTDQYATTPDTGDLDITGNITVAAWIKPESAGTEGIVKKGVTGGTAGYELSLGSSGKVFVRFNGQAAYRTDSATSYPTDGSTWVHVAGTYDGTTVRLYYNGVSENPKAASFSLLANDYPLSIGVNGNLTQYFFEGAIDDVRVYNRALSEAEIAALAAAAPANHAPVANDNGYSTPQDTPEIVAAPGVLGNDTDTDGDDLTAVKLTDPTHGTVSLDADGGFTYTPDAGYAGPDSFTYKANDGDLDSNTATVTITVIDPAADSSLVGYWAMDETDGTTAFDTGAAPANDATTAASLPFVAGRVGNAVRLNGTSQYASTPDEASLDITGPITMAAWIKPEHYATQDPIAKDINGSVDESPPHSPRPRPTTPPERAFVRFNQASSGDTFRVNATTMYPIDGTTWMHVAATWDGSDVRLYVNGILEGGPLPFAGPIATNATALGIGAQSNNIRWFQGDLDDVRLYSRALSAGEIAALAEASNQAPVCSDTTLSTPQDTSGDASPACTDPDGNPMTYSIVDTATHGTASVASGELHYVPDGGYIGSDTFTYRANDGDLDSNTASVTVSVTDPAAAVVMVGAGDIGDLGGSAQTAALINAMPTATVFTTGDHAYPDGTASDFCNYYDPTWGATRPVPPGRATTTGTTGARVLRLLQGPAGRPRATTPTT